MLKDKANAKINLGLNIVGILPNGYHQLEMLELPLELADEINIFPSEEYNFICNVSLPENNTVYKAFEACKNKYRFKENFTVVLTKQIPSQAGLGGGSADGAAMLRLLNRYYQWNDPKELLKLAQEVGSDVPFCLLNKPALVTGIGEKVKLIPFTDPDYFVLLIKPHQGVSTQLCYRNYEDDQAAHPDIELLAKSLIEGNEPLIKKYQGNSLENAAFKLNPQIRPIKQELIDYGFNIVLMTGSGACVYALSKDQTQIQQAYSHFKNRYEYVAVTKVLPA